MSSLRTFVAVEIEPAAAKRAASLIERLRPAGAQVTWVKPQAMHLTLKFLGDIPSEESPAVCRVVAEAVSAFEPFELDLHGAGAFPAVDRPRTVWAGVRDGLDEIEQLFQAVDAGLAKLRFPRERKRYRPHLTLGRVRRGGREAQELGRLIEANAEFPIGPSAVSEVVVFASFLDRSGPTYEALSRIELAGPGPSE